MTHLIKFTLKLNSRPTAKYIDEMHIKGSRFTCQIICIFFIQSGYLHSSAAKHSAVWHGRRLDFSLLLLSYKHKSLKPSLAYDWAVKEAATKKVTDELTNQNAFCTSAHLIGSLFCSSTLSSAIQRLQHQVKFRKLHC